jgi:ribonuclease D
MGFSMASAIRYHEGDISAADAARYTGAIAIDTETLGLIPRRDRLCVVQLSPGDGSADVVQIAAKPADAPNLKKLLADPSVLKIFHFARFDLGILAKTFGIMPSPVYCTKIASRLARTYTDRHGLKDLAREVVGQVAAMHTDIHRSLQDGKAGKSPPLWQTRPREATIS